MLVVAAEKHTCFYCTTYVIKKQFVFFWQAILSQGVQTIKVCVNKKLPQIKFVF